MNLLCLHCGRYGHVREACGEFLKLKKEKERHDEMGRERAGEEEMVNEGEVLKEASSWKVV